MPTEKGAVAIKLLRPRNALKERFRDALFHLSVQTTFAPRLQEDAVQAGLIWQRLLGRAYEAEGGNPAAIVRPLGYFWDEELFSFAEIQTWVEGRPSRHEPDDQLIQRWLGLSHTPPNNEIDRQRNFMARITRLCYQIGAIGLARQYEWLTLVSQANVLKCAEISSPSSEFTAVDFRPGLAIPFFLPLSPAHARIIWQGFLRGVLVHFDEIDLPRLDAYLEEHLDAFTEFAPLVEHLKKAEARYRAGLPDLWHRVWKRTQPLVRQPAITNWQKLGLMDVEEARYLHGARRFYFYLLLDNLPLFGHIVLRWLGNGIYREHWRRLLTQSAYRREGLKVMQGHDLANWVITKRVPLDTAKHLADRQSPYLFHKFALGFLPASAHRFLTDPSQRADWGQRFLHPFRLLADKNYQTAWFLQIIQAQADKGVVSADTASRLKDRIGEPFMRGFLWDLSFTVGLDVLARLFYLFLAVYGLVTEEFWLLILTFLGPISPSGIVRVFYLFVQLLVGAPRMVRHRDRRLLMTRLVSLAIAPWRMVGNLFVPFAMLAYDHEMSFLFADYFVTKMVNRIPVLGGPDKLLAHWVFQWTYNFPLSLWGLLSRK